MIVLLDTDVLIDIALDRKPHSEPALDLLKALRKRPGTAFIAWHSISNLYYIVRPTRGTRWTRLLIRDFAHIAGIAPTEVIHILQATHFDMNDFEDAMQVAAAMACGANVIATRNLRDYKRSPVPAASPATVLKELWRQPEKEEAAP